MNIEHATPELFAALSEAQMELENASKNAANPHFKSRYADLAEVLNTVRPVLARHGIALLQSTEFDGQMVTVCTTLAHKAGGSVSSRASCVPAKMDAQGVGSATTYLRRYGLAAMTGVAQEDDDGNAAAHNTPPKRDQATDASKNTEAPKNDPRANAYLEKIKSAADVSALDAVVALISKDLTLPESAREKLRAAFAAKKNAMRAA